MVENAILSRHTTLLIRKKVAEEEPENEWTSVGRLTNIPMPSPESEEIDISALDSPGYAKEFRAGPVDNGSIELTGQYKAGEGGQRLLQELYETKETFEFRIEAPEQSGVVFRASYQGEAYVSSCKPFGDATEGDILPFNATLRVTGDLRYQRELVEGEPAPNVFSLQNPDDEFETSIRVHLASLVGPDGIYYTTDDSTPDEDSTKYDPEEGITLTATTTIKAINIVDRLEDSEVSSFTFTKKA